MTNLEWPEALSAVITIDSNVVPSGLCATDDPMFSQFGHVQLTLP